MGSCPQLFQRQEAKKSADGVTPKFPMLGGGIGNFMQEYKDMHAHYCSSPDNKDKSVCKSTDAGNGMHPMFNSKHVQHKEWKEVADQWCELPENGKKITCMMRKGMMMPGMLGTSLKGFGIGR